MPLIATPLFWPARARHLQGITGYVLPGQLMALMGGSGCVPARAGGCGVMQPPCFVFRVSIPYSWTLGRVGWQWGGRHQHKVECAGGSVVHPGSRGVTLALAVATHGGIYVAHHTHERYKSIPKLLTHGISRA